MKVHRIALFLLPAALVELVYMSFLYPSVAVPAEQAMASTSERSAVSAEPLVAEEATRAIETVAVVVEPQQPVQSLEERGDAMLFECEVLFDSPFDHSIVMPFD